LNLAKSVRRSEYQTQLKKQLSKFFTYLIDVKKMKDLSFKEEQKKLKAIEYRTKKLEIKEKWCLKKLKQTLESKREL